MPKAKSTSILLSAGLLLSFSGFVYEAVVGIGNLNWSSAYFPLAIGIVGIVFSGILLLRDIRIHTFSKFQSVEIRKLYSAITLDIKCIQAFGWITVYVFGTMLIGFYPTLLLVTFTYLHFATKETWIRTIMVTCAVWCALFGIFEILLGMQLPTGLIGVHSLGIF